MSGDKLLDIAEHRFSIAGPEHVIAPAIFDIFGTVDLRREIATVRDRHLRVGLAMEHKRRYPHGRKDRGDVDLAIQCENCLECPRAARQPLELGELGDRVWIRRLAGGGGFHYFTVAPSLYALRKPFFPNICWHAVSGTGKSAKKHEMRDPIRIGRCEQHAHRATFGEPKQDGTL